LNKTRSHSVNVEPSATIRNRFMKTLCLPAYCLGSQPEISAANSLRLCKEEVFRQLKPLLDFQHERLL
jgi:hypothetical protein